MIVVIIMYNHIVPREVMSMMDMVSIMITAMVLLLQMSVVSCLTCPSSCGSISPVPYPFGARDGCGVPGFQISNCSQLTPQWNLVLGGTKNTYYIKSIGPPSNSTSINNSSPIGYGYGGIIRLSLLANLSEPTPTCEVGAAILNVSAFTSLNLYAFEYANLSFLNDRYFLFNCTASQNVIPDSGVLTASSRVCNTFLNYCNYTSTSCTEYYPSKTLYLGSLMSTYKCSHFKRFVIVNEDDPISSWDYSTQFEWGSVTYVSKCNSCQSSGGTCGYNTNDNSFLCYCGDNTSQTDCSDTSGSGTSKVVIGVVCAFLLIVLALVAIAFFWKKNLYYWWVFRRNRHLNVSSVSQAPTEFPYSVLVAATKSFSNKIGEGAIGKVFKGILPDGNEVAVKVLDSSVSHSDEQFLNEVATVGNIHHVNIARLLGFCFKGSRRILVYEYVCNNSLDKYLFSTSSLEITVLSWKQRYRLALGIAQGLSYMHEECRNCIIHCDIKPQNILLDADFTPKIADFGLAKLLSKDESRISTHARGTPGYVAPEFWSFGRGSLSAKFDVYSYGVVLLEIVQGKRRFDQEDSFYVDDSFVEDDSSMNAVSVFLDERIADDADRDQVRTCITVALWCIQEDPQQRPTMSKVVQLLQGSVPVLENPPRSAKWRMHQRALASSIDNSSEILMSNVSL